MPDKLHLQNGDVLLVMVKDGAVIHHSWNMSLPHVEFVRRRTGELPVGAWVGTVSKLHDEVMESRRSISTTINCLRRWKSTKQSRVSSIRQWLNDCFLLKLPPEHLRAVCAEPVFQHCRVLLPEIDLMGTFLRGRVNNENTHQYTGDVAAPCNFSL